MCKPVIGIVLPYLKSRGTEKQALRLASGFIGRGAKVVLFVVQGWGCDDMYDSFVNAGVKVVNVGPSLNKGKKIVNLNRVFSLSRLLRKHHCTVLLSRAGMTNKIAGLAGLFSRVPTMVVLSSAVKPKGRSGKYIIEKLRLIRMLWSLGFPTKIISVSKEGAENFSQAYPVLAKKVVAITNGIVMPDHEKILSKCKTLDLQKFYFCFLGSLEIQRKGLDVLLEAIKIIDREYRNAPLALLLIGVGEDELKIKDMVKSRSLHNRVVFAGEQVEPYVLMASCHAFVLPSRNEGMPNALLEAMALGLCVVSTDCDTGPREIITHGKDGLLVPPEDARCLADAMVRIYKDDEIRVSMANQGKKTVKEKFSYEKMVDGYFSLLEGAR